MEDFHGKPLQCQPKAHQINNMPELFPDGPVTEYSVLVNILYSFIWAFVLSALIAITHRLTFTGDQYPKNFFQALILGAIVTTLVMMAIGDSLARGLGVFGAMAIIRFRTRIDDPRDVLFLFAALSTGLAIGVYGYTISFVGTILFCVVAFFLHYSPFKAMAHPYHLFFALETPERLQEAIALIKKFSPEHQQISINHNKLKLYRYHFTLALKLESDQNQLIEALTQLEGISLIRITRHEIVEN